MPATAITRQTVTDATGPGTGTVWNNAFYQTFCNNIDALIANPIEFGASVKAPQLLTGTLSVALSASQNDWNPTGLNTTTVLFITASTPVTITGLAGGANGRLMVLVNAGSNAVTLAHNSGSSSVGNRFVVNSGANLALGQNDAAMFSHDGTWYRQIGGFI